MSDPRAVDNQARQPGLAAAANLSVTRREALRLGGLATAFGAAVPFLSACGGGESGGTGGVDFQGWDYESEMVKQNIQHFTKNQPKIDVNYKPITSAQYVQKVVAEYTARTGPDALYVYDDSLAGWVNAGYLQSLEGMPGLDKAYNAMYPSNAQTMTYQGKRYGLPYYTDTQALVYNAEILDKAGISKPPRTLDELEQQAVKIQNAGILKHPIGLAAQLSDTWWGWYWGLFFASGAKMFDDKLNPIMDSSDPVPRQVLEWIQHATQKTKVLDPASIQLLPIPQDKAYMAGQYAFTLTARYSNRKYNDPSQSKVANKSKMALIPTLDGKTEGTVSWTRMYSLAKETDVKKDAYKLIYYLGAFDSKGDPYTAKFWFRKEGLGFAYKDLIKDPEVRSILKDFADPATYERLAEIAQPRRLINASWYTQFETDTQKLIQKVMTGHMSPSAAVRSMADNATKLKKQHG